MKLNEERIVIDDGNVCALGGFRSSFVLIFFKFLFELYLCMHAEETFPYVDLILFLVVLQLHFFAAQKTSDCKRLNPVNCLLFSFFLSSDGLAKQKKAQNCNNLMCRMH